LLLISLQSLPAWNKSGLFITRAIPLACVIAFAIRAGAGPLHVRATQSNTYYWDEFFELHPRGWFPRAAIQADLKNIAGNHLVFVRYNPKDDPFPDWVYNDADIEKSKVIWARDLDRASNQELLDYYRDRHVWLLEPDEKPPRLSSYLTGVQNAMK
jgi:hypothetical protein